MPRGRSIRIHGGHVDPWERYRGCRGGHGRPDRFPFLHDRRHLLAILLTSLAGTAIVVFLVARGELAGADARAYWGGVRVWLDGGDPMLPPQPYLPYVYAPWSVPLFLPWALLPWDVAWVVWRGLNVLLLVWSATWAYQRHPLATAIILCILAAPIAAALNTGNLTLLCALGVWRPSSRDRAWAAVCGHSPRCSSGSLRRSG